MNKLSNITLGVYFLVITIFGRQPSIKLSFFDKIPAEIDGCGHYYTYGSLDYQNSKYVFVTNLQGLAFIRINGRQISLKQTNDKYAKVSIYKGGGYTVVEETKTVRQTGDEVWLSRGTLKVIRHSDKQEILIWIHGEGGC
ncbi:hypothetical protein [Xanthocytophaga agilis]|uniref:Uncharacterized protein n=1 Tax=Xanthocytophaga agilis TaxID=3048010 RepID=A0AAE3UDW7_9BACT|nr:hypothetical protein [Xanthocytophaga agilis]MDJ1502318.1 hypothetical protein [Xanthocytophaga agilis]